MEFTTPIETRDINISDHDPLYNTSNFDYDLQKANVYWSLDIEARSWGIKSLIPYITNVTCEVEILEYTDDEDILRYTIEIAEETGWTFETEGVHDAKTLGHFRQLSPGEITLDFIKKVVIVEF